MFQTTSEWVILGLTLLLGWLLCLMSRRGAGPYRRQLAEVLVRRVLPRAFERARAAAPS